MAEPLDFDAVFRRESMPAHERTQRLFDWLKDDEERSRFYAWLLQSPRRGTLAFDSRSALELDPAPSQDPPQLGGAVTVTLVGARDDVEQVLADADGSFSNAAYRTLGSGSFMLGLDPSAPAAQDGAAQAALHAEQQRRADDALAAIGADGLRFDRLAQLAVADAFTAGLARPSFDLAMLAEEIGLRYGALLFGFGAQDHALLRQTMAAAYRGLNHLMLGRHFVGEPGTLPAARLALGALATRADALMAEYARLARRPEPPPADYLPHPERRRWPEGVEPPSARGLGDDFVPLLKAWALAPGRLAGGQLGSLAAGMLAGIVGNVQASVCTAVDALIDQPETCCAPDRIGAAVGAALAARPPAPFLPRVVAKDVTLRGSGLRLAAGQQLILCLGAATADRASCPPAPMAVDPLVFGMTARGPAARHGCLGARAIWPLLCHATQQVLALPGLARRIDAVDGTPLKLEKRWGFGAESLPLQYRRERRLVQQPLQVIMRIRTPVATNAAILRRLVADAAPRVQRALDDARHVHFAWFQFVDGDTALALQTVYDGDFDAYVQHFALKVDDIFDQLFEYLEDAPPRPVGEHVEAFVETIRRFHRPPLGGYFYSAYPRTETWRVPGAQGAP